jgi:Flp pilus assembly pilin Flp
MPGLAVTARAISLAAARRIRRFRACESGATAIEYGLMAAFFSVTVIGASGSIKSAIETALTTVSTAIVASRN